MTSPTAVLAPAYDPASWGTFFTLTGTAAATLTGLFFLAFSMLLGIALEVAAAWTLIVWSEQDAEKSSSMPDE